MQPQKEKVLILGGTKFVGRQLVEKLLMNESYEVHLFNRGKTNPELFPNVNKIHGDRETDDIQKISNYSWDYVVDFSTFFPSVLKSTLENLNRDVKRYIFISTISVYSFKNYDSTFEIKEENELREYKIEQARDSSLSTYGPRKVECERILNSTDWLDSIVLRPSIIYGDFDPTDRLYYWIYKVKKRDKILLPDFGEHKISMTFSYDLVELIAECLNEKIKNGIYNCSTHNPVTLIDLLKIIAEILQVNLDVTGVPQEWLINEKVKPQSDIPLWFGGSLMFSNSKIKRYLGVNFTSFKDSIKKTVDYYEKLGWPKAMIGLSNSKETELLKNYIEKL